MTDALGSVLATFSNTAGAATMLGRQLYGPYGNQRYTNGSMGTSKGFTGQYNDAVTGLDYYGSRYYDPVAGVFLSPDSSEGNVAGLNPYGYVGGNPETWTDPSGQMVWCGPGGCGGSGGGSGNGGGNGLGSGGSGGSYGGGGYQGGTYPGGAPPTEYSPPTTAPVDPNNPLTWPQYIPEGVGGAEVVGGGGLLAALCFPLCFGVAGVVGGILGLGSVLLTPTSLASGELPYPIIPSGPDLHYPSAVNSLILSHSMVTPNAPTTPTTQTGGGGFQPPNRPHVSSSPDEPPDRMRPDLYRMGNKSSPRADNVRPQDISGALDENGNICPNRGGISTSSVMNRPANWWKLPADVELPEGLQARNDVGTHWLIEPSRVMTVDEFQQLLQSIQGWEPCF